MSFLPTGPEWCVPAQSLVTYHRGSWLSRNNFKVRGAIKNQRTFILSKFKMVTLFPCQFSTHSTPHTNFRHFFSRAQNHIFPSHSNRTKNAHLISYGHNSKIKVKISVPHRLLPLSPIRPNSTTLSLE